MLLFDRLQLLPRPFGQRGHPAAEHLRDIVAGLGLRRMHQRGQHRDPLLRRIVAQHRRVRRGGLTGEIGDLRRRHPVPPGPRVAEGVHPLQVLQLFAEVRPRRPFRGALQPVVLGLASGACGHPRALHARDPCHAQPPRDHRENAAVDGAADLGGHVVERAERRQFERAGHQPFQRDIDQVGRVVLALGGFLDRLGSDLPRRLRVVDRLAAFPDQRPVPLRGPRRGVHRLHLGR